MSLARLFKVAARAFDEVGRRFSLRRRLGPRVRPHLAPGGQQLGFEARPVGGIDVCIGSSRYIAQAGKPRF